MFLHANKQRERGNDVWTSVSRSAKPEADILISNLSPATWYQIKVESDLETNYSLVVQVTAEVRRSQSDSDHTSLEFEISTLAADGSGFSGDKAPLPLCSRLRHREGCEVPRKHLREQAGDQPGDLCSSLLQEAFLHLLDVQPDL